jgi:hypothetical protein
MQEEVMMQDTSGDRKDDVQRIKNQFKEMEEEAKELATRQKQLERELSAHQTSKSIIDICEVFRGVVVDMFTPQIWILIH